MSGNFDPWRPIYVQIIDEIRQQIARGELNPSDKLPSQRELAADMKVNPNTVQRVYREMESMGIIETRRGQGTFVVENRKIPGAIRQDLAEEYCISFIKNMQELGLEPKEIMKLMHSFLEETDHKEGDEDVS